MTIASQQLASPPAVSDPARCPLCGGPNDCQLCTSAAYKGPCWCESVNIPPELLVRVPVEARNRACICRSCVTTFHCEQAGSEPRPESERRSPDRPGLHPALQRADLEIRAPAAVQGVKVRNPGWENSLPLVPGDYYCDAGGLMVFTAAYHLRRGYCCGNACRHCPYQTKTA